jgi:DtxR family Mn-dependent transcriptional regulator
MDKIAIEMSESEEMYLITMTSLVERGIKEPIPISRLADELSIQPVSANQMVHKLTEENLVSYEPYKGVELTLKGRQVAQRILRYRRLWEVFLVEKLGVSPVEADALACRFEHVTPARVIDQLAEFLDHPPYNPSGLAIPDTDGTDLEPTTKPLADVPLGEVRRIAHLDIIEVATLNFLNSVGILPGTTVIPIAMSGDGELLLKVGDGRIHLSGDIPGKILVTKN